MSRIEKSCEADSFYSDYYTDVIVTCEMNQTVLSCIAAICQDFGIQPHSDLFCIYNIHGVVLSDVPAEILNAGRQVPGLNYRFGDDGARPHGDTRAKITGPTFPDRDHNTGIPKNIAFTVCYASPPPGLSSVLSQPKSQGALLIDWLEKSPQNMNTMALSLSKALLLNIRQFVIHRVTDGLRVALGDDLSLPTPTPPGGKDVWEKSRGDALCKDHPYPNLNNDHWNLLYIVWDAANQCVLIKAFLNDATVRRILVKKISDHNYRYEVPGNQGDLQLNPNESDVKRLITGHEKYIELVFARKVAPIMGVKKRDDVNIAFTQAPATPGSVVVGNQPAHNVFAAAPVPSVAAASGIGFTACKKHSTVDRSMRALTTIEKQKLTEAIDTAVRGHKNYRPLVVQQNWEKAIDDARELKVTLVDSVATLDDFQKKFSALDPFFQNILRASIGACEDLADLLPNGGRLEESPKPAGF